MTPVDHAIMGGAVCAELARPLGLSVEAFIIGAAVASLPDIIGRVGLWATGRWDAYIWAHTYQWWMIILFPWGLHVQVDAPMHVPDGHWWPRDWKIAAMYWLIEILWLTKISISFYVNKVLMK